MILIGTMENYLCVKRPDHPDRDVTYHCFRLRILGEIRLRKYSDTVCTGSDFIWPFYGSHSQSKNGLYFPNFMYFSTYFPNFDKIFSQM